MKECDIVRGSKHTLTLPTYFQVVKTPRMYVPVFTVLTLLLEGFPACNKSHTSYFQLFFLRDQWRRRVTWSDL